MDEPNISNIKETYEQAASQTLPKEGSRKTSMYKAIF